MNECNTRNYKIELFCYYNDLCLKLNLVIYSTQFSNFKKLLSISGFTKYRNTY